MWSIVYIEDLGNANSDLDETLNYVTKFHFKLGLTKKNSNLGAYV